MPRDVAFGPFRFRPESRELFRDGSRVPLPPKPAHALEVLALRAGQVVRREHLVAALWADAHVDFDKSLNFAMLQLRRALGDDARSPRYLETLPRLGYRLRTDQEERAPSPQATGKRARSAAWLVAVAAIAAMAIGAASWTWSRAAQELPAARELVIRSRDQLEAAGRFPARRAEFVSAAIADLEQAVLLDADRADYWLALADARFRKGLSQANLLGVRDAVIHALALDRSLADAHVRRGDLSMLLDRDWDGAYEAYRMALALDPLDPDAHRHLATYYLVTGERQLAVDHIERAVRLEPVSSVLRGEAGWILLSVGRAPEALETCDRALTIDPENVHARQCAMYASEGVGDGRRVSVEAAAILAARGPTGGPAPLSLADYHERYLATLGQSGWDRTERVFVLAAMGNRRDALSELDRVIADRVPHLMIRLGDHRLARLREMPEFQALVARLQPAPGSSKRPPVPTVTTSPGT